MFRGLGVVLVVWKAMMIISSPVLMWCAAAPFMQMVPEFSFPGMT